MYRSQYADVPALELPIHEAVLGRAAEFGEAPARIDGLDGTTLSYEQVDRFHRRLAAALAEAGVRKGDVLALHSPNTVAFPTAFYAATRAGAAVTTVHLLATAEEFATQLRDSGARWIVTVSPCSTPPAPPPNARAAYGRSSSATARPATVRSSTCWPAPRPNPWSTSTPPRTSPRCRTPPAPPAPPRA